MELLVRMKMEQRKAYEEECAIRFPKEDEGWGQDVLWAG